jgi:hypothetical protein
MFDDNFKESKSMPSSIKSHSWGSVSSLSRDISRNNSCMFGTEFVIGSSKHFGLNIYKSYYILNY